jgi:hypothetical protein
MVPVYLLRLKMHDPSIKIYDDVGSPELCQSIIDSVEPIRLSGNSVQRCDAIDRIEESIHLAGYPELVEISAKVLEVIDPCISDYIQSYPVLRNGKMEQSLFKYNYAPRFGGIQFWHCEQRDGKAASRGFVWMMYLNTQNKGGETEFLYQQRRIKAVTGRVVIFPAAYTHTHRSAPVWSDRKDIVTGVINFKS